MRVSIGHLVLHEGLAWNDCASIVQAWAAVQCENSARKFTKRTPVYGTHYTLVTKTLMHLYLTSIKSFSGITWRFVTNFYFFRGQTGAKQMHTQNIQDICEDFFDQP